MPPHSALAMAFVALLAGPIWAQSSLVGDWQGTLEGPQKLRAVLKVSPSADGPLTANLYSIDQAATPMPVQAITIKASAVSFTVPTVQGAFEGQLSAAGDSLTGVWKQGGGEPHALNFVRATKETAWPLDPSPHTVNFVTVEPGVKLEVLDWGGPGRALVLLAGLGNNAHVFDRFAPKLAAKYHVYAITRRGYGASDAPAPNEHNYTADRLGDDVLAVFDALKLTRPVLAGHSIAGEELSSIGSRHPERVAGLVYLDAGYVYAFYDKAHPDFDMELLALERNLSAVKASISAQDRKRLLAEVAKELPVFETSLKTHQTELADVPDMPPAALAEARKQSESKAAVSARAILNGRQAYTDIKCPVLAIFAVPHQRPGGAPDPAADAKDLARLEPQIKAFQTGLPQAPVVRIPHANHFVFTSNEADVMRELDSFVAGLP